MSEHAAADVTELARRGALVADPARAAMLLALMDGHQRPAGELARAAGVGASTASAHLKRLLAGGLLCANTQGRHRYYRLADDEVAAWLEAMALPQHPAPIPAPTRDRALRRARSCYRHLAGELGVALYAGWLRRDWLKLDRDGVRLQPAACAALAEHGWNAALGERLLTLAGRQCVDWTERRVHLGGPLGVAVTTAMIDAGWLRRARSGRVLIPSGDGLRRLAALGVRTD